MGVGDCSSGAGREDDDSDFDSVFDSDFRDEDEVDEMDAMDGVDEMDDDSDSDSDFDFEEDVLIRRFSRVEMFLRRAAHARENRTARRR